jgi:phytoene synthase
MQDAFVYCRQLVRETEKDRFLSALFTPQDKRDGLFALYAFDGEIARVRDIAREPMPGEIRLQWWREAIEGQRDGEADANPVARALLETIRKYGLPRDHLLGLIEARSFDLYNDPMDSSAALAGYSDKTNGAIFALAGQILGGELADAISNASGFAETVAGIVERLPRHATRGQIYLPLDLLRRHNADPANILAGQSDDALRVVVRELAGEALRRLRSMAVANVPERAWPALLPLALARSTLQRAIDNPDPFRPTELSPLRMQWLLWRAARNPQRLF